MSEEEKKIIKIEKNRSFSIISNECLRNKNISARAKGIYAYIMTLPEDWKLYKSELYNHFTEGRDALNTAFKELEDCGYIFKKQTKKEDGTFLSYEYTIYENAIRINIENQLTGNPLSGEQVSGNLHLPKSCIDLSGTNTINTNQTNISESPVVNEKKVRKQIIYPTLDEFKKFIETEGSDYDIDARNIYLSYAENDWHDSNGKKILNWKMKIRQVWFKSCNKRKLSYQEQQDMEYYKIQASYQEEPKPERINNCTMLIDSTLEESEQENNIELPFDFANNPMYHTIAKKLKDI